MPTLISHAGGAEHPPEGDIQAIRDLLKGYGSDHSLLKELIQNAEDAESTRLCLTLHPGWPDAPHTLLKTPGLQILNDGRFTEHDLRSMRRFGLGTKGSDNRAIGRFGKGLKSVFLVCESFFIIAKTRPQDWPEQNPVCELFSPWKTWFHSDWLDDFPECAEQIFSTVAQSVEAFPESHWLCLWLPLRHGAQRDREAKWIYEDTHLLPGEDPNYGLRLINALHDLAPHLASLRVLKEVVITDARTGKGAVWRHQNGHRRSSPEQCTTETVSGAMSWTVEDSLSSNISYLGSFVNLQSPEITALREQSDWPKVVVPSNNNATSTDMPTKGEPHCGALLTCRQQPTGQTSGRLTVNWAVFLPVGDQPPGKRSVPLSSLPLDLNLTLHGFAFLDSQRTRIDWLGERFRPQSTVQGKACLAWNRALFESGALPVLPQLLQKFFEQKKLSDSQLCELVEAFKKLWIWGGPVSHTSNESVFRDALCSHHILLRRWLPTGHEWQLEQAGAVARGRLRQFYPPSGRAITDKLPGLIQLASELLLLDSTAGSLLSDEPPPLSSRDWLILLQNCRLNASDKNLADWVSRGISTLEQHEPLDNDLVKLLESLPLHSVFDTRLGSEIRVSVQQIREKIVHDRCFAQTNPTKHWIECLNHSLGDFSCWLVPSLQALPAWCRASVPLLQAERAACVVLHSTSLAATPKRLTLVSSLCRHLAESESDNETKRSSVAYHAVRYLLHGSYQHVRNDSILRMRAAHDTLWGRFVRHLLQEQPEWTLIDDFWADQLTAADCELLRLVTIDAMGALHILSRLVTQPPQLTFAPNEWPPEDTDTILRELSEAGLTHREQTLRALRWLPIHALERAPKKRVSLLDSSGNLGAGFVLSVSNFAGELTGNPLSALHELLASCDIIHRSNNPSVALYQRELFKRIDAQTPDYAELSWNYVIRQALKAGHPERYAELILEALRGGDGPVGGISQAFKKTTWLPLALGGGIAPEDVVFLPASSAKLQSFVDYHEWGWATEKDLSPGIVDSLGFKTLKKYLSTDEQGLFRLAEWAEHQPELFLGLSAEYIPETKRTEFIELIASFPTMRGASLLHHLLRDPVHANDEEYQRWQEAVWDSVGVAIARAFPAENNGQNKLIKMLRELNGPTRQIAFDSYLRQFAQQGASTQELTGISLQNQRGGWTPAEQVIWPSVGIEKAVQLCADQSQILKRFRPDKAQITESEITDETLVRRLSHAPDFESEAERLIAYAKKLGVAGLPNRVVASFLALLGDQGRLPAYTSELLAEEGGITLPDYRLKLLGETADSRILTTLQRSRFIVELVSGSRIQAQSIAGSIIEVPLENTVESLLVGEESELWSTISFENQPETRCHRLRMRDFPDFSALPNLALLIGRLANSIVLKVYCNGVRDLLPAGLAEGIAQMADIQAGLEISREHILDDAEYRLRLLGVRGHDNIDDVRRKFDQARDYHAQSRELIQRAPGRAQQLQEQGNQLSEETRRQLARQIETDADTRSALLQALRRKLRDYQYSSESILRELFQNADDAISELTEMKNGRPQSNRIWISFNPNAGELHLVHWGRRINQHQAPGFAFDGMARGYHHDLSKMLATGHSDKGTSLLAAAEEVPTTGRFGLGFKSIFFVSDEPEVASGPMRFRVLGGFLPKALSSAQAEELQKIAERAGGDPAQATVFRLSWPASDTERQKAVAATVATFTERAPLLVTFAKSITEIELTIGDQRRHFKTNYHEIEAIAGLHKLTTLQGEFLAFGSGKKNSIAILFGIGRDGIIPLPTETPSLWVTAPLESCKGATWTINAPFTPDSGRVSFPKENPANHTLAQQLAHSWHRKLTSLAKIHFPELRAELDLGNSVTDYVWWKSFWSVVSSGTAVHDWEKISTGRDIPYWLAWDEQIGAVRRLYSEYALVPSQLPQEYQCLLKSGDLAFELDALFTEENRTVWEDIFAWPSFRETYLPGTIASIEVIKKLKQAKLLNELKPLGLLEIILNEIGSARVIEPVSAKTIGILFKACDKQELRDGPWFESFEQLIAELQTCHFRTEDEGLELPGNLLVAEKFDEINDEERLAAAIAPTSARLNSHYDEDAVHLLVELRDPHGVHSLLRLKKWILEKTKGESLSPIFNYLLQSDNRARLARELESTWLQTVALHHRDWKQLHPSAQQSINLLFESESAWKLSELTNEKPVIIFDNAPITQELNGEAAFQRISEWWNRDGASHAASFEREEYPDGCPSNLPWFGTAEWERQTLPSAGVDWLVLFANAALAALGLNKTGRNRAFISHLIDSGLAEALSADNATAASISEVIDDYLKTSLDTYAAPYSWQLRQFFPIYGFARFLSTYLEGLHQIERHSTNAHDFLKFTAPNQTNVLQGTGLRAPDMGSFIGIGKCNILRELYRKGRLTNPAGHAYCYFPTRKTRRLFAQLFGVDPGTGPAASVTMYVELTRLAKEHGGDPSFNHSFDLPFLLLAEQSLLRSRVLGKEFETEISEQAEINDAVTQGLQAPDQ